MSVFAKSIHIFNDIPIKFSTEFFVKLEKLILQHIWKNKRQKKH